MISNIPKIKKARELRLTGKSLSEIAREINLPRTTISRWVKDITLTTTQISDMKNRVGPRMSRGRLNASISLRSARMFKERVIFNEAEKEFEVLVRDNFFIAGLSLYWANGSKTGGFFQFSSRDKHMVDLIIKWIKKYVKVDDELVKHKNFNGYYRVYITRISVLRRVVAWQKLLIKYYKDTLDI